jgi:hypothetical protein
MDKSCNADTWGGNAFSFTTVYSENVAKNHTLNASVYCYVSKDFNGSLVCITDQSEVSVKVYQQYDFKKKGEWQKLQINLTPKSGIPHVYLFWSKSEAKDFSNLKGYVIFAYPEYEIKKAKVIGISLPIIQQKLLTNFPGIYQNKAGLFAFCEPILTNLLFVGIEKDPIRKWASKLISEDTTYYSYKHALSVDTVSNKLSGLRIMLWHFAWEIYSKEFNWRQKAFGGGFNFLNWYGFYFEKNKLLCDYPHNPFLSVLLYSGVFGLIIYLIFFYKVIYYYIKYFSEYKILSIFFAITFLFSFFSAGNPFDPPVMGFFSLLPFFIHHIHQRPEKL